MGHGEQHKGTRGKTCCKFSQVTLSPLPLCSPAPLPLLNPQCNDLSSSLRPDLAFM